MADDEHNKIFQEQLEKFEKAMERKGEIPTDRKSIGELLTSMSSYPVVQKWKPTETHGSVLPPSYPACTLPVKKMSKIMISELKLETAHPGRYLVLKVLTPGVRRVAINTITEDEKGDGVVLSLYFQEENPNQFTEVYERGMVVVVKEPYFQQLFNNAYVVRVDHVGNMVFLTKMDELIPLQWRTNTETVKYASEWKKEGDAAVGLEKYWLAISCYNSALRSPSEWQEDNVIKRNRALASLKLSQYDAVLFDLFYNFWEPNSSTGAPVQRLEKVLFRAAKALYGLNRFDESLSVWKQLRRSYPTNGSASPEVSRCKSRIQEQKEGKYVFRAMHEQMKVTTTETLDHASYTELVEVKETQDRGRGLFMKKSVQAGDLILCEKAFAFVAAPTEKEKLEGTSKFTMIINLERGFGNGTQSDLVQQAIQKLAKSGSLAEDFVWLYAGGYEVVYPPMVDRLWCIDSFLVERIIQFNAFGSNAGASSLSSYLTDKLIESSGIPPKPEDDEDGDNSNGVWVMASHINHSCLPNARRSFIGDVMIIRATEDIAEGTEVEFPYRNVATVDRDPDHEARQHQLRVWGFTCCCVLCEESKNLTPDLVKKRADIREKIELALNDCKLSNLGIVAGKLDEAEELLAALEKTYDRKMVGKIPLLGVWMWQLAITRVHSCFGASRIPQVLLGVAHIFKLLAFDVTGLINSNEEVKVKKWGHLVNHSIECWVLAWTAFASLRNGVKAAKCREYAILCYKMVVGEDETFKEIYDAQVDVLIRRGMIWGMIDGKDQKICRV